MEYLRATYSTYLHMDLPRSKHHGHRKANPQSTVPLSVLRPTQTLDPSRRTSNTPRSQLRRWGWHIDGVSHGKLRCLSCPFPLKVMPTASWISTCPPLTKGRFIPSINQGYWSTKTLFHEGFCHFPATMQTLSSAETHLARAVKQPLLEATAFPWFLFAFAAQPSIILTFPSFNLTRLPTFCGRLTQERQRNFWRYSILHVRYYH